MPIATGVFKKLIGKKQAALGTQATAASAQIFRRVTSSLNKKKAGYKSNEIRDSMQRSDFRHGVISVEGSISGELSVGTYNTLMASVLRGAWAATVTSGAIITVTAASTSGANGTFTRSGGSYFTDGFKVGMVVRWSGWATTGVPNNAHNFLITALTATVMTGTMLDGVAVGAKAAGDSVTCVSAGKTLSIPTSGHTDDYWTFEHSYTDITQSEVFVDCVLGGFNVKLPPSGMATIDFPVMGLDMVAGTTQYFTSPSAASSGAVLAANNGFAMVNGVALGLITNLEFNVNGNTSAAGGVVGSNKSPDVFVGPFDVDGTMTIMFQDTVQKALFLAETEIAILAVFTGGNTAAADFMGFTFPRCKLNGGDIDDGEKGLSLTVPFVALENTAGGTGTNSIATTIVVQDSLAP
jgi:hypothetical protein